MNSPMKGIRSLAHGLALLLALFGPSAGLSAQEPRCCDAVPEGETGVLVDAGPVPVNLEEIGDSLRSWIPASVGEPDASASATIWMQVSLSGVVLDTRIDTGSGSESMDAVFRRAAAALRFAPAVLDGSPVAVWIRLPFTMQVRQRRTTRALLGHD